MLRCHVSVVHHLPQYWDGRNAVTSPRGMQSRCACHGVVPFVEVSFHESFFCRCVRDVCVCMCVVLCVRVCVFASAVDGLRSVGGPRAGRDEGMKRQTKEAKKIKVSVKVASNLKSHADKEVGQTVELRAK